METSAIPYYAIPSALAAVFIAVVGPFAFKSYRPKDFPPGPPTLPFIGNLHLVSPFIYEQFYDWWKAYGPIVGLKFGPDSVVVLSDAEDVEALFEKRGAIYSSRPANYIVQTVALPDELHILLNPYGSTWKAQRKLAVGLLSTKRVNDMLPIQSAEMTKTLVDIVDDPKSYRDQIMRFSNTLIQASVFGRRAQSFSSPVAQGVFDLERRLSSLLIPGATPPVDQFWFIKYIPGILTPYMHRAKGIRKDMRELYLGLLETARKRMKSGNGTGCFMEWMIENGADVGLDDEHVAYAAGSFMEAASSTTASTILSFMLIVLDQPDTLAAAQAEVDSVCGDARSPGPEDMANLPYIKACASETLRLRPPAPTGAPHVLTQTDTYKGFTFPAGTLFFVNAWGIQRDEKLYEDPDVFKPERWLQDPRGTIPGAVDAEARRRETYAFGAGRRICVGQRFAENSLHIGLAKLVWLFNLSSQKKTDTSIKALYDTGITLFPRHVDIDITPRSEQRVLVVRKELDGLQPFFDRFETV